MTPACVFRVALDTPLKRLFDYLEPPSGLFATPVAPGMRVRVPFGRQKLVGIVMEVATSTDVPVEKLKPILEVLDGGPVLDASALALLQWAADYYHYPIGEVLSTALPKAMRLGATAEAREEQWSVTAEGMAGHAVGEPRRAPKQRGLLAYLIAASDAAGRLGMANGAPTAGAVGGVSATTLDGAFPKWRETARALVERGWVTSAEVSLNGGESRFGVRVQGPELRDEQRVAVDTIRDVLGRFGAFVLHGVTGSGKT